MHVLVCILTRCHRDISNWGIHSYMPHDFNLPGTQSRFTVGLTDDYSLDSIIWHGEVRGCALDSSWRNKNQNRAAMTLLAVVNQHKHAVPGMFRICVHMEGSHSVL